MRSWLGLLPQGGLGEEVFGDRCFELDRLDDEFRPISGLKGILEDDVVLNQAALGADDALDFKRLELPPALALMDMSLPVMDGWSATREIKNYPKTNTIPVIALTAHAMAGDREKSIAAGCDDYDTKPIEFTRLLEKIETLCKKTATP